MSNEAIIHELQSIRATAQVLADRATRLESQLNKANETVKVSKQFDKKLAEILSRREKRYQKK